MPLVPRADSQAEAFGPGGFSLLLRACPGHPFTYHARYQSLSIN